MTDRYTKAVLTVVAAATVAIAVKQIAAPVSGTCRLHKLIRLHKLARPLRDPPTRLHILSSVRREHSDR